MSIDAAMERAASASRRREEAERRLREAGGDLPSRVPGDGAEDNIDAAPSDRDDAKGGAAEREGSQEPGRMSPMLTDEILKVRERALTAARDAISDLDEGVATLAPLVHRRPVRTKLVVPAFWGHGTRSERHADLERTTGTRVGRRSSDGIGRTCAAMPCHPVERGWGDGDRDC